MQAPPTSSTHLQYQSFPDASGDSDSLKKLKALLLPMLAHKSFLDVGCNEGFFCGYALHDGARRVVGIDLSPTFIARARRRFPAAEFLCQSWEVLPSESFDVILLTSSLHYASDQSALIARLMQLLNPNGTLVLELGVVESKDNEWVQVDRGHDICSFPTWPVLSALLEPFAWKHIGKSVNQSGDPVPRHVIHVTRRKPLVYLMMQVPGSGKTSVASSLFKPANVPVISGDKALVDIAEGRLACPEQLKTYLGYRLDHTRLDEVYRRIFRDGFMPQLVQVWQAKAAGGSFALDAFIPLDRRDELVASFIASGYVVVKLAMSGINELESQLLRQSSADIFFNALRNVEVPHTGNCTQVLANTLPFAGSIGVLQDVKIDSAFVKVSGWAVHNNGLAPAYVDLRIDGISLPHQYLSRFPYPEVQQRLNLQGDLMGFYITVPAPTGIFVGDQLHRVQVFAGTSRETADQPLWSIPANTLPDPFPF